MARLNQPQSSPVSPLRLLAIMVFLISISGGLVYLFAMPLKQVYWGVYARVKPMVSEQDLMRQGKELPGGVEALREMIEGELEEEEVPARKGGTNGGGGAAAAADGEGGVAKEQQAAEARAEADAAATRSDAGGGEAAAKEGEQLQPPDQAAVDPGKPAAAAGGAAADAAAAGKPVLTKELVASVAQDNVVVVTWANYHYRDFVMNWVEHLRATGCTAFIVGAMDDKLLEFLQAENVPTFSMSSGLTLDDFGWGSPTFHKMGREKINLIYSFTKMGFDVLLSDVDTVWLRNPLPYMKQYPEADILTSSDHLINTNGASEGLEKWPEAASAANIGIMLFRPKGHDLAAEWVEVLEKDSNVWDQNAFNDLFRRGSRPLPERQDGLFECYNGKLKCGILPVSIFCSGHTGFTQRMPDKLGLTPYVVHATFQYSGTPGKRHRMRERLWWNDPPEYFQHPQGYIAYDDTVPPALLEAARAVTRNFSLEATGPHFDLVNAQLKQLRVAFALAQITGRAVVLPKLMCGMDRWWAPHDGTIPGSALDLPYICPADHVLDLESMSRPMPEAEFGPDIEWREFSFLENPRAAELNKSVLSLQVCQDATQQGCADGSSGGAADKLKPGLDDKALKALLTQGQAASAKVLRITGGIERLFEGWAEPAAGERFKRRLDSYAAIWCCVNAHPGHIWYDMFYDQVPHTDRHNRVLDKPWQPTTGP